MISIAAAAAAILASASVLAQGPLNESITVGVVSQYDFCLMLPPTPGGNIGDTEGTSLSRCLGNVPGSRAVGPFPDGFITSAHFIETPEYVQVSGNLDIALYNLDPTDGGGQYDSAMGGSRPYSMCANYPSYLSYVEPDQKRYWYELSACLMIFYPLISSLGRGVACDAASLVRMSSVPFVSVLMVSIARWLTKTNRFADRDTIGCVAGMPGTVFGEGFTANGVPGTKSMTRAVSSIFRNGSSSFAQICSHERIGSLSLPRGQCHGSLGGG